VRSSQKRRAESIARRATALDLPDMQPSASKRQKSPAPTPGSHSRSHELSSDAPSSDGVSEPDQDTPSGPGALNTRWVRKVRTMRQIGLDTQRELDDTLQSPPHSPRHDEGATQLPPGGHPDAGLDDDIVSDHDDNEETQIPGDQSGSKEDDAMSNRSTQMADEPEEDEDLLTVIQLQYAPLIPEFKQIKLNSDSRRVPIKDVDMEFITALISSTRAYRAYHSGHARRESHKVKHIGAIECRVSWPRQRKADEAILSIIEGDTSEGLRAALL
jgi:hypothetical protein